MGILVSIRSAMFLYFISIYSKLVMNSIGQNVNINFELKHQLFNFLNDNIVDTLT